MSFSLWASGPELCLEVIDVARACLHAKARRVVYVELPMQDDEENEVGLLKRVMCGTRDVTQNWEVECAEMMTEAGFTQRAYSARAFLPRAEVSRAVVHGDDRSRGWR